MVDKRNMANAQFISDYVFDAVPDLIHKSQKTRRSSDNAPTISFDPLQLVEFLAHFSVAYDDNRLNRLLKELNTDGEDSAVPFDTDGAETD